MNDTMDIDEKTRGKLERSIKYDVNKYIRFQCLIGQIEAELGIMIEPDPIGDELGTYAHFHTTIHCPNIKIVNVPEPDRCQITNNTCPFIAPFSSHKRDPKLRKNTYAHEIIHRISLIEFYGSQIVNEVLKANGLKADIDNATIFTLIRMMKISKVIDKKMFYDLEKIRKIRNKLVHDPEKYLTYSERDLHKWSIESNEISNQIRNIVENIKNNIA